VDKIFDVFSLFSQVACLFESFHLAHQDLRQLDTLWAILSYPHDLRATFERTLFDYYQAEIDGSYCEYGPGTQPIPGSGPPKLTELSQVWGLIDEPVVRIPHFFRTASAIEFKLCFNCEWDAEHGLGVRYRDWMPVKFGGWFI
jgi:Domain of unknown function (DUF6985)